MPWRGNACGLVTLGGSEAGQEGSQDEVESVMFGRLIRSAVNAFGRSRRRRPITTRRPAGRSGSAEKQLAKGVARTAKKHL